jgi:hypothetical protein
MKKIAFSKISDLFMVRIRLMALLLQIRQAGCLGYQFIEK